MPSQYDYLLLPQSSRTLVISENPLLNVTALLKKESYDYIVLEHVVEYHTDIQELLSQIAFALNENGKLIIIYRNYLYTWAKEFMMSLIQSAKPTTNWLSDTDLKTFLALTGYLVVTEQPLELLPVSIPLISFFLNKLLINIFPFYHLATSLSITAKKPLSLQNNEHTVSVIVPARSEAGTIETIFTTLPQLGTQTEVIFVEGHSTDSTRLIIKRCIKKYSKQTHFSYILLEQGDKKGKSTAVQIGFSHAKGEVLMILDADLSVKPSDLRRFYDALVTQKGEFINGSRLVYPIEKNAMQFLNILGNKFFSVLFSWILNQPIKDTLCGTKVLWRKDYLKIVKNKGFSGVTDPFGDFDLLLGAGFLQLKIIDLPVHYYARTYGSTNITRFRNGLELLKISLQAIKKMKLRL